MTLTGMPFCKGWTSISGDGLRRISLPESVPYDDSGDEYPVTYGFGLDGTDFETTVDADGGLDVTIEVHGVRPDHTSESDAEETLYWSIDTDGLDDLRKHLVKWWALRDAIATHNAPPAVELDLDRRANAVRSKLVSAMQSGSYTVKDRTDISGLSTAVQTAVGGVSRRLPPNDVAGDRGSPAGVGGALDRGSLPAGAHDSGAIV